MLALNTKDRIAALRDPENREIANEVQGSPKLLAYIQSVASGDVSCRPPDAPDWQWREYQAACRDFLRYFRLQPQRPRKSSFASQTSEAFQLSGVEWSHRGHFVPLPPTALLRVQEAKEYTVQLRRLMEAGPVGREKDATIRVKLQSLLMTLHKDAETAVQKGRHNDYETMSETVKEVHRLLDDHELLIKSAQGGGRGDGSRSAGSCHRSSRNKAPSLSVGPPLEESLRIWATSSTTPCATPRSDLDAEEAKPPQRTREPQRRFPTNSAERKRVDRRQFKTQWGIVAEEASARTATCGTEVPKLLKRIQELELLVERQRDQLQAKGEVQFRLLQDNNRTREFSEQIRKFQAELDSRDAQIARLKARLSSVSRLEDASGYELGTTRLKSRRGSFGNERIFEEEGVIEISCKMLNLDERVKVRIYIQNLSRVHSLEELSVAFNKARTLEVNIKDEFPDSISPGEQIVQSVSFVCRGFFVSSPDMNISFSFAHGSRSITVTIPLTIIRFCRPTVLTAKALAQVTTNPNFSKSDGLFRIELNKSLNEVMELLLGTTSFDLVLGTESRLEMGELLLATRTMLDLDSLAIVSLRIRGSMCGLTVYSNNPMLSKGLFYGVKCYLLQTFNERLF